MARPGKVADKRPLNLKAKAGMRGRGAIGGEAGDRLANPSQAEKAEANGSHGGGLRLPRANAQGPIGSGW